MFSVLYAAIGGDTRYHVQHTQILLPAAQLYSQFRQLISRILVAFMQYTQPAHATLPVPFAGR